MHPRPPPATGAGNRRTFGRSAPPSWPTVCGRSSAQPSRAPAAARTVCGRSSAQPSRAPAAARILASTAFAASNTAYPPSTGLPPPQPPPTRRAPSNGRPAEHRRTGRERAVALVEKRCGAVQDAHLPERQAERVRRATEPKKQNRDCYEKRIVLQADLP